MVINILSKRETPIPPREVLKGSSVRNEGERIK